MFGIFVSDATSPQTIGSLTPEEQIEKMHRKHAAGNVVCFDIMS